MVIPSWQYRKFIAIVLGDGVNIDTLVGYLQVVEIFNNITFMFLLCFKHLNFFSFVCVHKVY